MLIFLPVFSFERPIVKNITAIPGKINTITITWTLPEDANPQITEINIFRTLKQIKNFSQLKDENPLASLPPDSTGYTDKVPNYRDYFYTVIAKTKKSLARVWFILFLIDCRYIICSIIPKKKATCPF